LENTSASHEAVLSKTWDQKMACPVLLEQQIACILQSANRCWRCLDMNRKAVCRPTVSIQAVCDADMNW